MYRLFFYIKRKQKIKYPKGYIYNTISHSNAQSKLTKFGILNQSLGLPHQTVLSLHSGRHFLLPFPALSFSLNRTISPAIDRRINLFLFLYFACTTTCFGTRDNGFVDLNENYYFQRSFVLLSTVRAGLKIICIFRGDTIWKVVWKFQ